MSQVYVDIGVSNPQSVERRITAEGLLVDTGSLYTVVPEDVAAAAGLQPYKEADIFTASGAGLRRRIAPALIEFGGELAFTEVAIGKDKDLAVLGTLALDALRLAVDTMSGRLVRLPAIYAYGVLSDGPNDLAESTADASADTQWPVYEVFHQSKRGAAHEHVGAVHAPDAEMALMMARDQFARRLSCSSLWVVREDHIAKTNYEDEGWITPVLDRGYRDPKGYTHLTKGRRAERGAGGGNEG
jgi:ring-1,2-phenylacetyl-CoA epoxidase subunit PaaB